MIDYSDFVDDVPATIIVAIPVKGPNNVHPRTLYCQLAC